MLQRERNASGNEELMVEICTVYGALGERFRIRMDWGRN